MAVNYLQLWLKATNSGAKFTNKTSRIPADVTCLFCTIRNAYCGGLKMKRAFFIILALLVMILAACDQADEADSLAVVNEPGVVTVFKSPT